MTITTETPAQGAAGDGLELKHFLERFSRIKYVDALFVDMCGVARGKRLPVSDLPGLMRDGLLIPESIFTLDVTGDQLDIMGRGGSDGDPDACGVPIPGTLAPSPWAGPEYAQVLMRLREDGRRARPAYIEPRNILAAVEARFIEMGLTPVIACELEFDLIDPVRAPDGRPQAPLLPGTNRRDVSNQVYGLDHLDYYKAFINDLRAWGDAQDVPTTAISTEFAPGQLEVNLRHQASALTAADHAALLRRLVKGTARAHAMEATFMAKPYLDRAGNGFHVHVSLMDAHGNNVFDGNGAFGSEMLLHAIGGLRASLVESMAIFSANLNAFRRYQLHLFVPMAKSWGYNNRSVAIRIPDGPNTSRRLEHRVAGADANPYLTVAAILAGMHYGIVNKVDPGAPMTGNAGLQLTPDLPLNQWAALDAMAAGKIIPDYFAGGYAPFYIEAKRKELEKFMSVISPLEYEWYL